MKPIVVYRLGSLGDTIVALPCLHKIAEAFPGSERVLLTTIAVSPKAPSIETILRGTNLIHRVLEYPVRLRSWTALLDLRRRLMAVGADTLVYLAESRGLFPAWRDLLFFKLCGFRRIYGIPLTPDLQRCRIDRGGDLEPEHERLGRTIAALGALDFSKRSSWDLALSPAELSVGMDAVRPLHEHPFVAINMGGKVARNDWGRENWCQLLARLGERFPSLGLLIVGAAFDAERAQEGLRVWPARGVDACGKLTVRETAAALSHADAFIGHDSGPLHLAAAVDRPCVGLFSGNNPPRRWHPAGTKHHIIHRMAGIEVITVLEVLDAATTLLTRAGVSAAPPSAEWSGDGAP